MADKLGIHPKTLQHYELGKSHIPTAVLFLAAHLLHISPNELIHENDR